VDAEAVDCGSHSITEYQHKTLDIGPLIRIEIGFLFPKERSSNAVTFGRRK
jgi:hypothetical protein